MFSPSSMNIEYIEDNAEQLEIDKEHNRQITEKLQKHRIEKEAIKNGF